MVIDLSQYKPLPNQKRFHDSKAKYRCYFGGFGSGKTIALCYEALMLGIEMPGNRILIGRKTYPELEATTKFEFLNIVPPEIIKSFRDQKNDMELMNGTVYFFRSLDSIHKIKSLNLGAYAIDEASEITEDMFTMLGSRLRYGAVPRTCGILSTNSEGHNWLWRRFVNKEFAEIEKRKNLELGIIDDREMYDYVVAPTTENTYLPKDYIPTLEKSFSPAWVRRYIHGSFEEFSGLVFWAFSPERHITDNIESVKKSEGTDRFIISIDPGTSMTAVLFAKYEYATKRVLFFDEIYKEKMGLEDLSRAIKARLAEHRIQRPVFLIDPSSKHTEQTSKSSVFKDLQRFGISCKDANNDVTLGILRMNEMLGRNQIVIYKYMRNFIAEINEYYIDEKTGKPKAYQKDHLCDNARYIVNYLGPSEISDISREQEIAMLKQRRGGLRMFKKHRGRSIRNYLTEEVL